ncbi:MAG: hypothetical protein H7Y27_00145, partial [Gemmatimonadaceae bacterium]|nr:hypothetical protein [Chitinophagaceae bacterium]
MKNRLLRILFLQSLIPFLFASISFAQPATWQPRGPGGGGSLFFPTINPANDNEFYVTCDMSQLFHSTDFGNSYEQVPFSKLQVGNISTYEFTNNSNIAYCIANDGNINYAVRTINGGNSWAAVPGNPLDGEDVFSLKADYDNPARIVLGYYDRLYFSNDTGKTFTLVRTASGGSGLAVGGVFFESANIYIGTNEGLLVSSNGGSSFSVLATTGIPASQTIFSMAGARQGGVTRLFCVTANTADVYNIVFPWDYYNFP